MRDHYFRQQAPGAAQGERCASALPLTLCCSPFLPCRPCSSLAAARTSHPGAPTPPVLAPAGAVSDRLRTIMKEVSTLPGQLPLAWESSILVAVDEERMDVLRCARVLRACVFWCSPCIMQQLPGGSCAGAAWLHADLVPLASLADRRSAVITAPPDTPYACGAWAFDVFLPPEYPRRPPMVNFLTTGGGRARVRCRAACLDGPGVGPGTAVGGAGCAAHGGLPDSLTSLRSNGSRALCSPPSLE